MAQEEHDARADLVRRGVLDQDHPLRAMHLRHATRLADVLDTVGWPGVSRVGAEGAEAAWLVAQHAAAVDLPLAERCVDLLARAVAERRAAMGLPELAAHTRALETRHRTERGLS